MKCGIARAGFLLGAMLCAVGPAQAQDASWAGTWKWDFDGQPAIRLAQASPTEIAFWQSVQNSNNPDDFQAYLDKYPNGMFAALAKVRKRAAINAQYKAHDQSLYQSCVAENDLCENAPDDVICRTPEQIAENKQQQRERCRETYLNDPN